MLQRDYSRVGSAESVEVVFGGRADPKAPPDPASLKLPAALTTSAPYPGEPRGVVAVVDQTAGRVQVWHTTLAATAALGTRK